MIRFCFGRFGALKPTTKIEQKISVFKKMKTETDLKFCNGSVNFRWFFWFLSFVHTPNF